MKILLRCVSKMPGNTEKPPWILRVCRLIFGEADFLPGIVIDKFSDILVVESLALGIDRWKPVILEKLKKVLLEGRHIHPQESMNAVTPKVRLQEGMERYKGIY